MIPRRVIPLWEITYHRMMTTPRIKYDLMAGETGSEPGGGGKDAESVRERKQMLIVEIQTFVRATENDAISFTNKHGKAIYFKVLSFFSEEKLEGMLKWLKNAKLRKVETRRLKKAAVKRTAAKTYRDAFANASRDKRVAAATAQTKAAAATAQKEAAAATAQKERQAKAEEEEAAAKAAKAAAKEKERQAKAEKARKKTTEALKREIEIIYGDVPIMEEDVESLKGIIHNAAVKCDVGYGRTIIKKPEFKSRNSVIIDGDHETCPPNKILESIPPAGDEDYPEEDKDLDDERVQKERIRKRWIEKKFQPKDLQMTLLMANPDDVLISHQPGEGKTISAILFAEMKREIKRRKEKLPEEKLPRIVVIAPSASILIQWQDTVTDLGFNPKHWVFQTHKHFFDSRIKPTYPDYNSLDEKTKEIYDQAWMLKGNQFVLDLGTIDSLRDDYLKQSIKTDAFGKTEWLTRPEIRERISNGALDMRTMQYITDIQTKIQGVDKGVVYWNGISVKNLKEAEDNAYAYICKNLYTLADFMATNNIFFFMDSENLHIVSDLILEKKWKRQKIPPYEWYTDLQKQQYTDNKTIKPLRDRDIKICKSIQDIKDHLLQGAIRKGTTPPKIDAIDQFISTTHGKSLLQHRYRVEQETIFIVDECHETLSHNRAKPITETLINYSNKTVANILVSATPFLSTANREEKLQTVCQMLQRGDEARNELSEASTKDVLFRKMYGKMTRALYDTSFQQVLRLTRQDSKSQSDIKGDKGKVASLEELYMELILHGRKANWDGLVDAKTKTKITDKFLESLVRTTDKNANPFPYKQSLGYKKVPVDTLRHILMDKAHRQIVHPYFGDLEPDYTIKFYPQYSSVIRKYFIESSVTWYDTNFYPVVIKCIQPDIIGALQEIAFRSGKFIVILNRNDLRDDESIISLLKRINVRKYNSKQPLFIRDTKIDVENLYGQIGNEDLKTYLRKAPGSETKWMRLKTVNADNDDHYETKCIKDILSSKVKGIVRLIQRSVAEHKNVIVYDESIEVLNAIEFGLKMYGHQAYEEPNDDTILHFKAKLVQKWWEWGYEFRVAETKYFKRAGYKEAKYVEQALNTIGRYSKPGYEYIMHNKTLYKLEKPAFRARDGKWTVESGYNVDDMVWGKVTLDILDSETVTTVTEKFYFQYALSHWVLKQQKELSSEESSKESPPTKSPLSNLLKDLGYLLVDNTYEDSDINVEEKQAEDAAWDKEEWEQLRAYHAYNELVLKPLDRIRQILSSKNSEKKFYYIKQSAFNELTPANVAQEKILKTLFLYEFMENLGDPFTVTTDKTIEDGELIEYLDELKLLRMLPATNATKRVQTKNTIYIGEKTFDEKQLNELRKTLTVDSLTYGIITAKHTPNTDSRKRVKEAFEIGLIDCILMNDAGKTGIDFKSTRQSICILVNPTNNPGIENQFVGRLVRHRSHELCPPEFRTVQYVSFQTDGAEKVDAIDDIILVKTVNKPTENVVSTNRSNLSQIKNDMLQYAEIDNFASYQILENVCTVIVCAIDSEPIRISSQFRLSVDGFYKNNKFVYDKFEKGVDYACILRNFLENFKNINLTIESNLKNIQNAYYKLKKDLFLSMISDLTNDGNVSYDIDSVLVYKGHVFMSPYDLLMSSSESLDDKKFPCKICGYEKVSWLKCEKCKHIGGEHYKMEKPYAKIDDISVIDVPYTDSEKVKQYKEATREIATLDLGLSCVSIEHTIKCRKDMHMSVKFDNKTYMQRIFPDAKKWDRMRPQAGETHFDVVVYPKIAEALTFDGEKARNRAEIEEEYCSDTVHIEEEYYSDN